MSIKGTIVIKAWNFQTIFTKHSRLSERNSGHFRLLNFAVQFNQTLSFSVTAQSSSWIHIEQLFTDGEVNRGRNFSFRCGLYLRKRKWAKKTVTLYVFASAHAKGAKTGRDFHLLAHGLSLHTHEVCIWICLVPWKRKFTRKKSMKRKQNRYNRSSGLSCLWILSWDQSVRGISFFSIACWFQRYRCVWCMTRQFQRSFRSSKYYKHD